MGKEAVMEEITPIEHECGGILIETKTFDPRFSVSKCSRCKKSVISKKEESKPADK